MANGFSKQASTAFDMQTVPAEQVITDHFTTWFSAPVSKLDADQYSAEDIDGVTEGLFGSGNLNYLMMQSGQTNESMSIVGAFENPFSNAAPSAISFPSLSGATGGYGQGEQDISTDRPFDNTFSDQNNTPLADGNYSNGTVGTIGASSLSADTGKSIGVATSAFSSLPEAGSNGNGESGHDGERGTSGINGLDGTDATGGGGETTVINEGDSLVEVHLGDTDLGDITHLITTTIDQLTEIINTTEILETVNNLVHNLFGWELGDITLDLNLLFSDISEGLLDANILGLLNPTLERAIDLNPVLDILGDHADLADLITGTLGTHIRLLGGDDYMDEGDFDLLLNGDLGLGSLGLPPLQLDIPLNPLEQLLGDIDIDTGATADSLAGDLLGGLGLGSAGDDTDLGLDLAGTGVLDDAANIILDPVEDIIGDVDILGNLGFDLLGIGGQETDNEAGDSDLNIGLDADILDNTLLGGGIDIPLDPVEDLIGDIDLDLTGGADILGDAADTLIDGLNGGAGDGGLLDGLGNNLAGLGGNFVPGLDGDDPTDSDLVLDSSIDLLGEDVATPDLDGILDPVEALLGGDIDSGNALDLNLLNNENIDNTAGDTDLAVDLDIDIAGIDLAPVDIDIPLDPLEGALGDIDIHVDEAANILDTQPGGGLLDMLGTDSDDGGILAWPENTLPDAGGILGGNDAGMDKLLPDPLGSIVEGLGILPFAQDHDAGQGGGLFGGGLFG